MPPRNPRRSAFRKYLEEMDKESLIEEIERIMDKFEEVRKFYMADLSGDPVPLIRSAHTQLERAFRFSNGQYRNPKASKLNRIIKDFEKVSLFREDVLELLLKRLELSVGYINHHRLSTGAFLQSAGLSFRKACTMTKDLQAEEKYRPVLLSLYASLKDRELREQWEAIFEELFNA